MKPIITFCSIALLLATGCANTDPSDSQKKTPTDNTNAQSNVLSQTVLASCGHCQFEMSGAGCDLAVKINGENYYVDGTSIDAHGDAHGEDGLCNCVRQAKVIGQVKDGRFVASEFSLLPLDAAANQAASDQN